MRKLEEIWIRENHRSQPIIRIDWTDDFHNAFNVPPNATPEELAMFFRHIASYIEHEAKEF